MSKKASGDTPLWAYGAVAGFIVLLLMSFGVIVINLSGVTPTTTTTTTTITTHEGEQVDMFLSLLHELDDGAPAATPVNLYRNVNGQWEFWQTASSSSGRVTFTTKGIAGTQYAYQVRASGPGTATYVTYTTPLKPFVCPTGDVNGDADIDDVVMLWETSTSAATFSIEDQDGNTINTEATQYVNATDTSIDVKLSITADCSYGTPTDFTDYSTGYHYLSGAWLVLKCTTTQDINNAVAHFYSSSLHFYIFRIPMVVYDSDLGYLTGRVFTIDTGTATFTASTDFDFDIYDTCKAINLQDIDENSFSNGDSDLNPTAVANKVA